MIKDSEIKLKYVGGASFVRSKPVFSKDARFIFLACSNRLYGYTTKTGKRYIEYKGLDDDIVGVGVYLDEGTEYLAACTIAGHVVCWEVTKGVKIKKINIGHKNIKCFKMFEHLPGKYKVFVAWVNDDDLFSGLMNLAESFEFQTLDLNLKFTHDSHIDFGGQGKSTFITLISSQKMFIVKLTNLKKTIKIHGSGGRKFTCVSCHPELEAILTGDDSGQVIVWQNFFVARTQTVFHWHTLPVNTVCFSSSGSTFYSGADECVLVKWTMENSHRKQFLPRLPSGIQQLEIAPENLYLAVATKDNAVHILDMQFNHVSIIQELILGEGEFPAGIHLDPRSRALVLNGTVGHLQFYSPLNMQLLYSLDIVGMNRITNERNTEMENTEVKAVAISKSGLWMVTIEERTSDGKFSESRLKFWNYNETSQSFQLNTNVEYPHEGNVIDLKFQPSNKEDNLRMVTIGADGNFKVWLLVDATTVDTEGGFAWRCASSGFYRKLVPTSMAFSYDGSLLAVGFGNILTTWAPDTCALKCSLLHPDYHAAIRQIAFGTSTQCHLVVVATKRRLSVWNLLTLSMIWTVELKVVHLISDFFITHMGVITWNNKLFVFEPASPNPLYVHEALVADNKSILAAAFLPNAGVTETSNHWYNKSQLFIIDSNKELHCLDSSGVSKFEPMQFMLNETQPQSMFGLMTPAHKTTGVQTHNVVHRFTQKTTCKKLEDLLDTPIHTMLPMRMIAHSIISSFIYEKNQQDHAGHNDEATNPTKKSSTTTTTTTANEVMGELAEDLSKIALEPVQWTSVLN